MKFHYDKKQDALYLRFNESPYKESEEIQQGIIFDYDSRGKIIGIEVLNASKKFPRKFQSEISKSKIPITLMVGSEKRAFV